MKRQPRHLLLLLLLQLGPLAAARAQARLYFDARIGAGYNFAEGAHAGKGVRPFKARNFLMYNFLYLQPRLQLTDRWALTAGYRGSASSWGYKLEVPPDMTVNPFPQGDQRGSASGPYMHQFPLEVHYAIRKVNWVPLDTLDRLYLLSFRLDVFAGGGLNRVGDNCLDCANFNPTPLTGRTSPYYDIIEFRAQPYYNRTWGGFLVVGATARFYRQGKERLNFSLALTQGLTDMLIIPVQYSYNGRLGATVLQARGTGVSATLGYPFLVSTFARR